MELPNEIHRVSFGDVRINKRCKEMLRRVSAEPAKSFPAIADNRGVLKAYYRFLNNPRVNREKILSSHVQETVRRCRAHQSVLVIQDTTTLSFQEHPRMSGLGFIGTPPQSAGYGMLSHNVCAVTAERHEILGLIHQEVMVRTTVHGDRNDQPKRQLRQRESAKWHHGVKAVQLLLPDHPKIIHVADREADMFFFMRNIIDAGQGFVIRQTRDRETDDGRLETSIANARLLGTMQVDIERNGSRKARTAAVSLRIAPVTIHPPAIVNRVGEPLAVNLVVVKEEHPPQGTAGLYWVLLTSEPVETLVQCVYVVQHYQARWIIEEFHKALKTGCSIEQRQLTTRHGLENVLGMFSIIAIILLDMRYQARLHEHQKSVSLTPIQQNILRQKYQNLPELITNHQALRLVAMLGGFLGRTSDGNPGWLTILRGYEKLLTLEQGFLLALQLVGKG